jgi:integrase
MSANWKSEKEVIPQGSILENAYFLYRDELLTEGRIRQYPKAAREAILIPAGMPLPQDAIRIRKYREHVQAPSVAIPTIQGDCGLTVRELVKLFTDSRKDGFKPSTWVDYEGHFENYILPHFGSKRISALRTSDLQLFVNSLKSKLHPRTIKKITVTFQSAWTFARKQEYVARDICTGVEFPKMPRPEKTFFKPGEVDQVIEAAPAKYQLMIILAVQSGIRRGELLGLRVQDIMFKECKLRIRNNRSLDTDSDPKSGHERQMPIPKAVVTMLREYVGNRTDGYVFRTSTGTAIGLRNASRLLDEILDDAGIKRPGLGWHSFRRYRATELAKAGIPEAHRLQWMGHADVDVDNGYVDTDEEAYQQAMIEKLYQRNVSQVKK